MVNTPLSLPSGKSEFNFDEATKILGLSSKQLRELVAEHLVSESEAVRNLSRVKFRPADLIMLSMVGQARSVASD